MPKEVTSDAVSVRNIGGSYFHIPARILPVVDCILAGKPANTVTAELASVSGHKELTVPGAIQILQSIFVQYGMNAELVSDGGISVIKLTRTHGQNASAEDSIRLKLTVLPGRIADSIASLFSIAFNKYVGAILVLLSFALLGIYASKYGIHVLGISYIIMNQELLTAKSSTLLISIMLTSFLVHELGHCAASARFGRKVKRVGFGIYWIFPVFFSDVSSTWELERNERVMVDIGGVYFQFMVCAVLAAINIFFENSSFLLVTQICIVINLLSIASSLNPMLKFDGYWVFSDLFGIPNLRRQSDNTLIRFVRRLIGGSEALASGEQSRGPLVLYSILSIFYSTFFTTYLCIAIWSASGYALNLPHTVWQRWVGLSSNGNYLAIVPIFVESLGRVFPLIVAPLALVSAFSGITAFVRRIFQTQ